MNMEEILSKVDHTLLSPTATWNDIKTVCDDGIKYNVASICIPSSYVKDAFEYVQGKVKICTVIGFPNGNESTDVKCFEASDAVLNGADEIDMVINIGWLKEGRYDDIFNEINYVKHACLGRPLKVIVETCLLTEEERAKITSVVDDSNADYIKTSTGFSISGARYDDIKFFKENIKKGTKIKASGGISSFEGAEKFIEFGADRLGTSKLIKIAKERDTSNT